MAVGDDLAQLAAVAVAADEPVVQAVAAGDVELVGVGAVQQQLGARQRAGRGVQVDAQQRQRGGEVGAVDAAGAAQGGEQQRAGAAAGEVGDPVAGLWGVDLGEQLGEVDRGEERAGARGVVAVAQGLVGVGDPGEVRAQEPGRGGDRPGELADGVRGGLLEVQAAEQSLEVRPGVQAGAGGVLQAPGGVWAAGGRRVGGRGVGWLGGRVVLVELVQPQGGDEVTGCVGQARRNGELRGGDGAALLSWRSGSGGEAQLLAGAGHAQAVLEQELAPAAEAA